MEGAGKGSECIKTLRMRGSVPVHRNLTCINAWRWGESVREHRNYLFQVARHGGGGKRVRVRRGPSASKYKVKIGCKDMEGRVKGPSTERIKVHRNLKSKSAESRSRI